MDCYHIWRHPANRGKRIRLLQLEWNDASERLLGQSRDCIIDRLTRYGYELCRPDEQGNLIPINDFRYGRDVFARLRK